MALQWGGRTFTDIASFARWLASRGQDFNTWAASHPAALAQLGSGSSQVDPRQYASAIGSEGIGMYENANTAAEGFAERARGRSAISALIGDYGAVPEGWSDKLGVMSDPRLRELATNNPFSTIAQLDRQKGQAQGNLRQSLAARGAVQSGELKLGEADIGYNYGLNRYQALRDLMSQIGGIESEYAGNERGRQLGRADTLSGTVDRLLENGFSPGPAGSSTTRRASLGPTRVGARRVRNPRVRRPRITTFKNRSFRYQVPTGYRPA